MAINLHVFHMLYSYIKRRDVLGMLPTGFGKSLTNFLKLSVDMPNTTHKLVILSKVTLEFV